MNRTRGGNPVFGRTLKPKISKLKKALDILADARSYAASGTPLMDRWKDLMKAVPEDFVQKLIRRETSPSFRLYPRGTLDKIIRSESEIKKRLLAGFKEYIPAGIEGLSWPELLEWASRYMKKHERLIRKNRGRLL